MDSTSAMEQVEDHSMVISVTQFHRESCRQVLILAKSAKGRAAVALIQQTISNPSLYHFGEILEHENIMALEQSPEFKPYLEMLRIFAYGTLSEYRANPSLPPIDDMQVSTTKRLCIQSNESHLASFCL
jgi:hypothetical protein